MSRRLIDVTIDELVDALVPMLADEVMRRVHPEDEVMHGLPGIMETFGCGRTKAGEIRKIISDVIQEEPSTHRYRFNRREAINSYLCKIR